MGLDAPSVQFAARPGGVGQDVVAIGSPLAWRAPSPTASSGQDARDGRGEGEISYINALQTDAAINPGNSGGRWST